MHLVFATNNKNKIQEIESLLKNKVKLLGLEDINCFDDIPETQNTIEKNASQKSNYIYKNYKVNCFADDSGLEIEALGGKPGVLSARYAGGSKNSDDNINKVLEEMKGVINRKAKFKTVISLIINGQEQQFCGIVDGVILENKKGRNGFGYDPIFQPDNSKVSFAEMNLEQKNKISHRGIAVRKLVRFLKTL